MILPIIVGTTPRQISQGNKPKTLIIYNNSASIIYLTSDASKTTSDGISIPVGNATGNPYVNYYAKGDYYLIAASDGLDARVET